MKTLIPLALVAIALWLLCTKGPRAAVNARTIGRDVATGAATIARHTADANEVIDWATK